MTKRVLSVTASLLCLIGLATGQPADADDEMAVQVNGTLNVRLLDDDYDDAPSSVIVDARSLFKASSTTGMLSNKRAKLISLRQRYKTVRDLPEPASGLTGALSLVTVGLFCCVILALGSISTAGDITAAVLLRYGGVLQTGDRVKIGNISGDVVARNLLLIRIRTAEGGMVTIPNSKVLRASVTNYGRATVARPSKSPRH